MLAWLRLLADPDDCGGGRARADPAAGRAALGRPRPLHDDRPAAQARHDLGARGGAREPAAPARGARPDPGLPEAPPRRRDGARGDARRRLRAPADRADRPAPPAALRRQPGDRRAAASTSRASPSSPPPGRGASRAARRATSSATSARSPRRASSSGDDADRADRPARSCSPSRSRSRASSSTTSTCSGCDAARSPARPGRTRWIPERAARRAAAGARRRAHRRASLGARLRRDDPRAAALVLVLAGSARARARRAPSPLYEEARAALGAEEEDHEEELFGPAEGLHATYRMLRDEVLEASWRAGSALSRAAPRHRRRRHPGGRALPRAAQARGADPAPRRRAGARRRSTAINELLGRVASPEQRAALEASALDEYLLDEERERDARAASWSPRGASRRWRRSCPARGERPGALGLRHRPLPDLPAEVQVRARLRDPAGADDQPALRDPHPPGARALPRRGAARRRAGGSEPTRPPAGGLDRLLGLFEAGWRRTGLRRLRRRAPVPRPRGRGAAPLPRAPAALASSKPSGSSASSPSRSARTSCAAASTASTSCPTAATS